MQQTNHQDNSKPNKRLMVLATYASVATAALIIIIKIAAWTLTDSLSLLSSLVDSILDIFASLLNLVAVSYAIKPADDDHRFGHGKAEDIAALAQSTFVAGSALFIGFEAIQRIYNPVSISHEKIGIGVMTISILLTLLLVSFQRYVVKKTNSSAIQADLMHYLTDLFVNLAVIISFAIYMFFGWQFIDPIFALGIAFLILSGAGKIAKSAFDNLMDKEFSDKKREKIIEIVLKNTNVQGIHDLRTRKSGIQPFIQFHLEIDGKISLNKAHEISDEVETAIKKDFPDAEIIIHQDPVGSETVPLEKGQTLSIDKPQKKK